MSRVLKFTVFGNPRPCLRAQFSRRGKAVRVYDPQPNVLHKALVRVAAQKAVGESSPTESPVGVEIRYHLKRPKSVPVSKRLYPTVKPDVDNMEKLVLDGMNKVVWKDDAQVVDLFHSKRYTDGLPRTEITVTEITE